MSSSSSATPPTCCVCQRSFETNETLYSHVSIAHAATKKFSCYARNRSFPLINSWRKHIRKVHSHFNIRNATVGPELIVPAIEPQGQDDYFEFDVGNSPEAADDERFHYQYSKFICDSDFHGESDADVPFKNLIKKDTTKFAAFVYSLPDVSRKRSSQFISTITSFLSGFAFSSLEERVIGRLQQLGETRENINSFKRDFEMMRNPFESIQLNSEHSLKEAFRS